MSSRSEDHALLLEAVRAAGPVAMGYFRGAVKSWEKNPGDPVSEADHAVDAFLNERLTSARPDYGWLSEETEDDPERLRRDRVWIVDPIDGTRAFLEKLPEFGISAALVEHGRPVLAAVYNPAKEQFFEAVRGAGARLNGQPIAVSDRPDFEGAHLLAGPRMFERAGWEKPPNSTFKIINSIAYRMALVAAGEYDGCVSLNGKSDWDLAAAELVVNEAGGRVSTARGEAFVYNGKHPRHASVIAAGPAMHARLLSFLETVPRPPHARW